MVNKQKKLGFINKYHVQGFIIGLILGTAVTAYAATRVTLVSGNGQELGTDSNPMYAEAV